MNIALPQLSSCSPGATPAVTHCRAEPLSWGREPDWDRFVVDHPHGTVFHTLAWRNAVRNSFRHEVYYLTAIKQRRILGVLPLFLVRGPIIGRMLVSVPYAVAGGVVSANDEASASLFHAARRKAEELKCVHIDFRSVHAELPGVETLDKYVGFERELPHDPNMVLDWLPRKARAVVRNAYTKFGLTCEFEPQSLHTVWTLYCRNMRRLASINYPYHFFEQLTSEFGDRCWLSVVRLEGRPVAGLLTLTFRDRVIPYFFGCEEQARRCGAANFVYYRVMERAVAEGFRVFDFGRSRRDNTGSCDFKRFHGFSSKPLGYQRHVVAAKKPVDLTPTNPALGFVRRVWPHLPLVVTRPAGAMMSRFIPG